MVVDKADIKSGFETGAPVPIILWKSKDVIHYSIIPTELVENKQEMMARIGKVMGEMEEVPDALDIVFDVFYKTIKKGEDPGLAPSQSPDRKEALGIMSIDLKKGKSTESFMPYHREDSKVIWDEEMKQDMDTKNNLLKPFMDEFALTILSKNKPV